MSVSIRITKLFPNEKRSQVETKLASRQCRQGE